MRSDNCPDWTRDDDPDAPWNQPEPEEMFGGAAIERITAEMNERGERFDEWLIDNGYLPDDEVDDATTNGIIALLVNSEVVKERYYEYRIGEVLENLQQEVADLEDYARCERCERRKA